MLSNWIKRGGLNQLIAPDENVRDTEEQEANDGYDTGLLGELWNIVAPDPNFPALSSDDSRSSNIQHNPTQEIMQVRCIHCNHLTPIDSNASRIATSTKKAEDTPFFTPQKKIRPSGYDVSEVSQDEGLKRDVLSAAVDLAKAISSPTAVWEPKKNFFNLCASTTSLSTKQLARLQSQLEKDPELMNSRSSRMGNVVPDGFLPIHAAAYAGNYEAAKVLISFRPEIVHARDVQGRTALHIASERGRLNVVQLLKNAMARKRESVGNQLNDETVLPIGADAPTDLVGRTPLAWAATSSEALAIKNREGLEKELFSPEDRSVVGIFTPPSFRMGGDRSARRTVNFQKKFDSNTSNEIQTTNYSDGLAIAYGFSEMPGMRIAMEDAMCYHYPLKLKIGSSELYVGFFGVFDGHGDGGYASRFVAENVANNFTKADVWNAVVSSDALTLSPDWVSDALKSACRKVDEDLQSKSSAGLIGATAGGSTGVMAVVSKEFIVVANVGDSRCILVERNLSFEKNRRQSLEGALGDLSLNDESVSSNSSDTVCANTSDSILVKALSTDHKPNLPNERTRIEQAGFEVISESFLEKKDDLDPEGSNMTVIWKVKKGPNDKLAVSRAFGDFDYKANTQRSADEQAIVSIPDIEVHHRNSARDLYLVLACDGVYDVMTNEEIGRFIIDASKESDHESAIAEISDLLLKRCLEKGSRDNMSVLILAFSPQSTLNEVPSEDIQPKALQFAEG